jgi:xanthine dehydrogenase accessory factor
MSNRSLIRRFTEWQTTDTALVLATVIHTEGSTYSKAGRHILIRANGEHEGLISGGCLEGDLAEQARSVFATGAPQSITYDMRDTADDLWGIGLGCNGMMQILLQRLSVENHWQPFTALTEAMTRATASTGALVISSDSAELPPGICFIDDSHGNWQDAVTDTRHSYPLVNAYLPAALPAIIEHAMPTGNCALLHWQIRPWPRLLLLGAGPDALPVVLLATILGWETTVADHRQHYIESGKFAAADKLHLLEPHRLSEVLSLDQHSAIVVMSHHIETDRRYLQQLADSTLGTASYVGILGPAARRTKLLNELNLSDTDFAKRLRGPVGLDIGADSPETIALSLISEIQSFLNAT